MEHETLHSTNQLANIVWESFQRDAVFAGQGQVCWSGIIIENFFPRFHSGVLRHIHTLAHLELVDLIEIAHSRATSG
jgi:hypothetical protein